MRHANCYVKVMLWRTSLTTWLVLLLFLGLAVSPALAQKTADDKAAEQKNRATGQGEAPGSTLEVAPGAPILKTKDITQESKLAPWKRLPRYVLQDQKRIWTSPFHTGGESNAKWWAVFGGATAVLIASDRWTSKQLPNTKDQIAVSTWTSRLGSAPALLGIGGGFYFIGLGTGNQRFRETGILGFEALANAEIITSIVKVATRRERPLEGNGNGSFFSGNSSISSASFPSGHAMTSWALASVVAHEYPRPLIVPITAYALATTVCASRFAVRRHFASDIVIGAGMGWFIGDYVFAKRHNRELDKPSALERVRAHVHMGGPAQTAMLPHPAAEKSMALASGIKPDR
jgi:membrane-associated phospholipid phosphatase